MSVSTRRALHRSTSSLELTEAAPLAPSTPLRREFGSHGELHRSLAPHLHPHPHPHPHHPCLPCHSSHPPHPPHPCHPSHFTRAFSHSERDAGDSFFAMLQNIKPTVTVDQRSPGPADYLRTRPEPTPETDDGVKPQASPKLRLKFHKFWAPGGPNKMRPLDDSALTAPCFSEMDETIKRRGFAHYDCQSLTANLGLAAKLRGVLLGRRRNTTTGASAASMLASRAVELDGDTEDDAGDGCTNELIENCPFFRNEIGGEEERNISLNWKTGRSKKSTRNNIALNSCMHQPSVAYGLSILEFPTGQTHWNHMCYLSRQSPNSGRPIECQDEGALYYRKHFYNQEHQNWFGMDEQLGPIAISIRKERTDVSNIIEPLNNSASVNTSFWQYRIIIRTAELLTIRGSILEDAISNIKPSNNNKMVNTKEVIEYVAPEVQLSCLRLGIVGGGAEEQLLRLDEQCISRHYKVGIMYCKQGQASEEDMYNNQEAGPALVEFLQMIGQTVRLKGFEKYKAGLDNKTDSTGLYSVYTMYKDCEIMFHVSTMLPYTPNNRQQLLRKRHIGNDIVTIVFQEPGAQRFTPKNIRSQFQHVFIVVRAINPCSDNTHYSIAVSRSKEVPIFGPPIIDGGVYPKGKVFTDLLLAKIINGENAAHRSAKFSTMATRTRQEYLKDLSKNYISTSALDTGQKFSLFSSLLKTSGTSGVSGVKLLGNNSGNLNWTAEGALCWPVVARDEGRAGASADCFLGLSRDTFVLIEECTRQIVFVAPTVSILGWNWWGEAGGIRVYFHRGESVAVRTKEVHEAGELYRALTFAGTTAAPAEQLQLRRNNAGQLGFHVQPDGVVTQVESGGGAARAGLRQGARLVEICTVAVCTLSHDQMVDLLKTSAPVTVTAIPPLPNGSTRGCCTGAECPSSINGVVLSAAQLPGRHRKRYERSFSPPRSSASSGYGTGSSSKSYCPPELWSADVPLESDKSPASPENHIPYRSPDADFSLNKIEMIEPTSSLQSSKVVLTRRHSQEMTTVTHSEFRGDKIWPESNVERIDSSPRPQQNPNSRRGTPASGHQSPAGTGEARLRIPRTQRYSAGGNTTLQEDLMKLINPDYIEGSSNVREEGILTQARPATVISSTSSSGSPAPNPPLLLPDARLMDWPSLVDTATRAMLQICEEQYPSLGDGEGSVASGGTENLDTGESWNSVVGPEISSGPECCPLRRQVNELENKINKEVRTRRALEEEVKRLRHHNRRLREESMRAVQQLQRFTNWFFQTVERQ